MTVRQSNSRQMMALSVMLRDITSSKIRGFTHTHTHTRALMKEREQESSELLSRNLYQSTAKYDRQLYPLKDSCHSFILLLNLLLD